ncbi:MAG: GHMP kinase [Chitinivibrionales bacterium]|nr:GHMP kinase [Chitinivibrionales bacterium]
MGVHKVHNAVAPIRICDIGGWTDTWFAGFGSIFNIAVYPYVEVQIRISEPTDEHKRVTLNLENFGDTYKVNPEDIDYDKHPLIEAAVDVMEIPREMAFHINIYSSAPPGASAGTSAAVSVALIGALDSLTAGRLTPHETAMLAHSLETEKLGLQCGIQDQLCSAYGGINFIEMHSFPRASVSSILIPNDIWWELERRLAVVYIGVPHSSSAVHQMVIADLGQDACNDERMIAMRKLAHQAKDAVYEGNFVQLGAAMDANSQVQRELHKELVCAAFEEIIEVAKEFGALGCKVNGAGGDGGSLTILTNGDSAQKRVMLKELGKCGYQSLDMYLSRYGIRVWQGSVLSA